MPFCRTGQVQTDLRPQQRQRGGLVSKCYCLLHHCAPQTFFLFFPFSFTFFSLSLLSPSTTHSTVLLFYPQFPLPPFRSPRTLKNKRHPPLPGPPKQHKRDGDTPTVQPRVDFVEPVCSGCLPPLQRHCLPSLDSHYREREVSDFWHSLQPLGHVPTCLHVSHAPPCFLFARRAFRGAQKIELLRPSLITL